jgi:hypothetical protein
MAQRGRPGIPQEEAAHLAAPHVFNKPRELHTNEGKIRSSVLGLQDVVEQLAALGRPFLNWAGKAERLSFDVPALPLFVYKRLSTVSIIETLKNRRKPTQSDPKRARSESSSFRIPASMHTRGKVATRLRYRPVAMLP